MLCTGDQQFLRIVRRAEIICPARKVALVQIGRGDVPRILKAGFARQRQDFLRREEAEKRCPACHAAAVTLTMPLHRYDERYVKPVLEAARRLCGRA